MLDIKRIRKEPETVAELLARKGHEVDFSEFLSWDQERRSAIGAVESLKAKRNRVSAEIPQMKKRGEDPSALLEEMKSVAAEIKQLDEQVARLEEQCNQFLYGLPNLPDPDVQPGGKENNLSLRVWGKKPEFSYAFQNHVELTDSLGLVDYARGAKLGGNGYCIYTGLGAQLEWALLNYFIADHLQDGYEMLLVPHMLKYACGFTAGQFPKFEEEVYWIEAEEGTDREQKQFILPTAETALVNVYRDEILEEEELPRKFFAYTPCYRKEAGSYRAEERGMIRGHQFNKVELFQFTKPEDRMQAFEEMCAKACRLVEGLGLHFRLSQLAAGDCTSAMARTNDIEIWIPSMGIYKEVSSASLANDYQARRGNIRFRRAETGKTEYVYTLNASGLATSRVLPALLEQNQQEDGSVVIPEVLRPYMGGLERLTPVAKK